MKKKPLDFKPELFCSDTLLDAQYFMPAITLKRGEHEHVICPEHYQHKLLASWFSSQNELSLHVVHKGQQLRCIGGEVAVVLNGLSLLANLSIRENIMLPFLYHYQAKDLNQFHRKLQEVSELFGLNGILDEQAGSRSPLIHGQVSLCRAVLQQASFMIMQQPCASMDIQEAELFTSLAKDVVKKLDLGMVYLATSAEDYGGFDFTKCIHIEEYGVSE